MLVSAALVTALSGLAFGLSLIVVVGAQNTFVLRQGLLRQHVAVIVAICTVSDAVLITAGVAGGSALLGGRAGLLDVVSVCGAAFLLWYAAAAARRAVRPSAIRTESERAAGSRAVAVASCLAFTWLNPAVYLDTVVLLGSVANSHGRHWWFAAGALLASAIWFVALGYGARLLAPLFSSAKAWRVLDVFVALVMTATAVRVLSMI